jgi:hypothetical protein
VLFSLSLVSLPAQAVDYIFSDDSDNLPPGCAIVGPGSYSCGVLTLGIGDTISIGGTKPATITFTGAFTTGAGNLINADGLASDLTLVTVGALTLGADTIVNASVTGTAAVNLGIGSTLGGNLTLASPTGIVTLAANSQVDGYIHTDAGAVTVGTLGSVGGEVVTEAGVVTLGADAEVQGRISTVAGGITIGDSSSVGGEIATQLGVVTVGADVEVQGGISTVAGAINVGASSRTIGGGITTEAGVVTLTTNVKIDGDIRTIAGGITMGDGSSTCGSVITTGAGVIALTTNVKIGGSISSIAGAIGVGRGSMVGGDVSPAGAGVVTLVGVHVGGNVASGDGAITLTDSRVGGSVEATGAGVVTITNSTVNDLDLVVPTSPACFAQSAATVTLGNLSQTYSGNPLTPTPTTSPEGLTVDFTYDGSTMVPSNIGSYEVIGTINDIHYFGSASGTLVINPEDPCLCDDTDPEFNIRDLDLLATFDVYLTQYNAARDVWNLVKDVLHCEEEGIPLEEEKRGFVEEEFFIAEDSQVIVTVIYDGAGYYNSVAFYDAADPTTTWKTIWESFATGPSAPLIPGSSASLGIIPAGTELRFGLVMDGGNGGTSLIYQDAYLNPGGLDFMASNILGDLEDKPLIVAFEDQLFEGRDNDFNDVILKIDIIPTAMGIAQHDETIESQDGLNSDRGSRGVTALLENFGINDPSHESTAELFEVPAALTALTFALLDDRSPMKFTLYAFDYDLVSHLNPESLEFRTIAATTAVPLMDNRTIQPGGEVTINPQALGLDGKTIALMMIPNNTVENFLKNGWRYTPTGDGNNTKRQPLFSLINANPSALDQMLAFYDNENTYLTFEDSSNLDGTGEFDDIQLQMRPALQAVGFHNGHYFEGSPDPTQGFTGPDGYGGTHIGGF